jgi:predicted SPOUT superfamily RNA methylase MTH1
LNLSIAIPDSALSDETLKIDKTRKIAEIARACAIFKINTIYIYQDGNNKENKYNLHLPRWKQQRR